MTRILDTLGRMLLGNAVRRALLRSPRVLIIAAALVGLALISIGNARAQAPVTRSQAFQQCEQWRTTSGGLNGGVGFECRSSGSQCSNPHRSFSVFFAGSPSFVGGCFEWTQDCPADAPWDPATNTCKPPSNCELQSNLPASAMYGGQPICVNGCTYVPDSEAAKTVRYEDELDSSIFTGSSSWKPNGAECSAENHPQPWDPQKPTCKTVPGGGFNHCTEPSGRNCVTSSQGRRMCWEPNEYGERMTADGKEGANRQPPGTPAPPPKAMENPQQAGSVTNTTNNSTSTTTVFNGGGNSGGQGNVGTGGKEGSGSGGDGEGIDFGSSGPGLGTLFEGEGHTEESVAAQIYTAAQGADIARGLVHFFQVPSSGACPTWSLPSTDFWDSMTIDQHCAGDFAAMLAACGWVVLAAIGFLAFRIAFY